MKYHDLLEVAEVLRWRADAISRQYSGLSDLPVGPGRSRATKQLKEQSSRIERLNRIVTRELRKVKYQ